MRNDAYWRERMRMLEDALLNDSYETVKNIEEQFARANRSIEADLARWYQRFADNNEITLAEAKRLLTSDELAEFKWTVQDYIKHGQSLNPAWAKQLENASARVHISRLDSLKIQLQQHAEELAGKTLAGAESTITGTYRESYYHTAFEFQKGIGLGWSLQSIDKAQIDKVLSKPWSTDMKTFRDRCWTNKEALVNSVNKELTQMIMRGESPDRAIKAIQKQFNVAKNKAGCLTMTESAAFAATARQDCFESLGIEQYVIVGTLDNKTCSLCGSLDGKHFKMSEYQVGTTAPPFHPWCRCCTAPYYDDWDEFDVDTYRAARDDEGEYYEVPRDMTYKAWKEKAFTEPAKARYNTLAQKIFTDIAENYSHKLNVGQQNKHIVGTNEYDPARGTLTADPQELFDLYGGKSEPIIGKTDNWTEKERFYHTEVIGVYRSLTGEEFPTTNGIIHYSKTRGWHIRPAKPGKGVK